MMDHIAFLRGDLGMRPLHIAPEFSATTTVTAETADPEIVRVRSRFLLSLAQGTINNDPQRLRLWCTAWPTEQFRSKTP